MTKEELKRIKQDIDHKSKYAINSYPSWDEWTMFRREDANALVSEIERLNKIIEELKYDNDTLRISTKW